MVVLITAKNINKNKDALMLTTLNVLFSITVGQQSVVQSGCGNPNSSEILSLSMIRSAVTVS